MTMDPHPVKQEIKMVQIDTIEGQESAFALGWKTVHGEIDRIEACTKPGLHCDIPYVRVWVGTTCIAELCQHNVVGVFFNG